MKYSATDGMIDLLALAGLAGVGWSAWASYPPLLGAFAGATALVTSYGLARRRSILQNRNRRAG